MYAQVEKPKENKSRAVADSVAQKKSTVKQSFGFVDNRHEAIAQRKHQEMANNNSNALKSTQLQVKADNGFNVGKRYIKTYGDGISKNEVAQLTKIIVVQNSLSSEEIDDINTAAQSMGGGIILDWDSEIPKIEVDEKVIFVAHGNTKVMGDEEEATDKSGTRMDIDFDALKIAKLLDIVLPDDYSGSIDFIVCDSATKISKKPSMVEQILSHFQTLRQNGFQGVMHGYPGAVDSDMGSGATVTVGGKEVEISKARKTFHGEFTAGKNITKKDLEKRKAARKNRLTPGSSSLTKKGRISKIKLRLKRRGIRANEVISDNDL